jgi:metallophosphoesterase superfamily enzyme
MKYVKSKRVSPFTQLERLTADVSEREGINAEKLSVSTFKSILTQADRRRFDKIIRGDMREENKAAVTLSREELELLISIVQEAKGASHSSNEALIYDVKSVQDRLQAAYRENFNGRP